MRQWIFHFVNKCPCIFMLPHEFMLFCVYGAHMFFWPQNTHFSTYTCPHAHTHNSMIISWLFETYTFSHRLPFLSSMRRTNVSLTVKRGNLNAPSVICRQSFWEKWRVKLKTSFLYQEDKSSLFQFKNFGGKSTTLQDETERLVQT